MGILEAFKSQLAEVIQWQPADGDLLWWKHPSQGDEIMNASKLIVAPGQGAVLVYEGEITDVIDQEGIFNLKTDNHPFYTTLTRLRQRFESEHKLYIYFYRRADVVHQPWGTSTPIKLVDEAYGFPVELGVHGVFSYRISDVRLFYTQIIGSVGAYSTDQMRQVILERIIPGIVTTIHTKGYRYTEIDGRLVELSEALSGVLTADFLGLGIGIQDFRLSGTHFDDETLERISRIADVRADRLAAEQAGLDYVTLEKLRAMRDAARNEGGVSGAGMQMGVGLAVGKQMGDMMAGVTSAQERPSPPQADGSGTDPIERLRLLKQLHDEGILSEEEFLAKKQEILAQL